jgi:glycosylphosphatidylinositol deacylase
MSFSESLDQCIRNSLPILFLSLTFLATYLARTSQGGTQTAPHWFSRFRSNATETVGDYTKNDLLIGSPDPHFWFLLPVFGIVSVGLCIAINYAALSITYSLTALYSWLQFPTPRNEDGRYAYMSIVCGSTSLT